MANEDDSGGPAFPVTFEGGKNNGESPFFSEGMTLRDWFAGQALSALPDHMRTLQTDHRINIAEWAYGLADSMIVARKAGAQ